MKRFRTAAVVLIPLLITVMGGCGKKDPVSPGNGGTTDPLMLSLSKNTIRFEAGYLTERIVLSSSSRDWLNWEITEKPDWLDISKWSGVLRASSDTLRLAVSASGLDVGVYQDNLHIRWNGGEADIQVRLEHKTAELDVNLPILNFDRNGLTDDLVIFNRGTEPLVWQIVEQPQWVFLDQDSGVVLDEPQTVMLAIRAMGLPYGEYDGTVKLTSTGGDLDIKLHLSLRRMIEVFPGESAADIRVGVDTYQKIVDTYGQYDSRAYNDDAYYHSIGYSWLGLRFDFYSDQLVLYNNTRCHVINMRHPFDGLTEENIGLGNTRDDVVAVYGQPQRVENGESVYDIGIAFSYSGNVVEKMRIWEP